MAKFEKGHEKKGGRQPNSLNTLTKTVKDTVLSVFIEIQEDPEVKLSVFAKNYPKEFYAIAAKLIPTEVNANIQTNIIKVKVPGEITENDRD